MRHNTLCLSVFVRIIELMTVMCATSQTAAVSQSELGSYGLGMLGSWSLSAAAE